MDTTSVAHRNPTPGGEHAGLLLPTLTDTGKTIIEADKKHYNAEKGTMSSSHWMALSSELRKGVTEINEIKN
jgi:hypothetical protein